MTTSLDGPSSTAAIWPSAVHHTLPHAFRERLVASQQSRAVASRSSLTRRPLAHAAASRATAARDDFHDHEDVGILSSFRIFPGHIVRHPRTPYPAVHVRTRTVTTTASPTPTQYTRLHTSPRRVLHLRLDALCLAFAHTASRALPRRDVIDPRDGRRVEDIPDHRQATAPRPIVLCLQNPPSVRTDQPYRACGSLNRVFETHRASRTAILRVNATPDYVQHRLLLRTEVVSAVSRFSAVSDATGIPRAAWPHIPCASQGCGLPTLYITPVYTTP